MGKQNKEAEKKIIRPGKDIIAEQAESLNQKLFKIIHQGVRRLTLDFKNVKSLDPVGLSVIAAAHNTLNSSGAKMILKNVSQETAQLLETLGLSVHFEIE